MRRFFKLLVCLFIPERLLGRRLGDYQHLGEGKIREQAEGFMACQPGPRGRGAGHAAEKPRELARTGERDVLFRNEVSN